MGCVRTRVWRKPSLMHSGKDSNMINTNTARLTTGGLNIQRNADYYFPVHPVVGLVCLEFLVKVGC